jgi:small subunit ribosomal protein S6
LTTRLYETMFLLDNQMVREDWNKAKGTVLDLLQKHGAKVLTARRWDERRLAYPIAGRKRATYLLAYFEAAGDEHLTALRRDLELNERILRYLMLKVDKVPDGEAEKAAAEGTADFVVPAPPPDDAPEPEKPVPERPREEEVPVPEMDLMAVEDH